MTSSRTHQRLEKLSERAAQIQTQIKQLRQQDQDQQRKNRQRRERLAGAVLLEAAERGELPREQFLALLDTHLTRPRDRELFELPIDPPALESMPSQ